MRILLTTTSYQDTPGAHHQTLEDSGFKVVRDRGPLNEAEMLTLVEKHGGFDGLLNGDDEITARVIDAALAAPTPLKVIAKYGIGLDSIDVPHATAKKIPVLFTPGVNHTTVAEHAFGLMVGLSKHFKMHLREVEAGNWKRQTGTELAGKTLGVIGMGRIGKEVIKRGVAFGMPVLAYRFPENDAFAARYDVQRAESAEAVLTQADVISLHLSLTDATRGFIDAAMIAKMKNTALLINTARGGLVNEADIAEACKSGQLGGYAADVVNVEPLKPPHPYLGVDNIMLTPHIGSRTVESVGRQAMRATLNLVNFFQGDADFIQANKF